MFSNFVVELANYLEVNSLMVEGQDFFYKHFGLISATEANEKLSSEKFRLTLPEIDYMFQINKL